jgi:hypothetical protein
VTFMLGKTTRSSSGTSKRRVCSGVLTRTLFLQ